MPLRKLGQQAGALVTIFVRIRSGIEKNPFSTVSTVFAILLAISIYVNVRLIGARLSDSDEMKRLNVEISKSKDQLLNVVTTAGTITLNAQVGGARWRGIADVKTKENDALIIENITLRDSLSRFKK